MGGFRKKGYPKGGGGGGGPFKGILLYLGCKRAAPIMGNTHPNPMSRDPMADIVNRSASELLRQQTNIYTLYIYIQYIYIDRYIYMYIYICTHTHTKIRRFLLYCASIRFGGSVLGVPFGGSDNKDYTTLVYII